MANNPNPGQGRNIGAEGRNDAREALPARIWAASLAGERDAGPVRAYLAGRGAWPPSAPLPPAVRWLPREALAGFRLRGFPDDAAGAAIYAFAGPAGIRAVQAEPLTAGGERRRWRVDGEPSRKSLGPMRGAAFRVPGPDGEAHAVHVAEGPVDALAIAAGRGVRAWAAGGTAGLAPLAPALAATRRPIVIEADGDGPGRTAAAALQDALHHAGATARLIYWPGCDPADGLAADWQERAALAEADGMDRREAEATAWETICPTGEGTSPGADNRTPKGNDHDR